MTDFQDNVKKLFKLVNTSKFKDGKINIKEKLVDKKLISYTVDIDYFSFTITELNENDNKKYYFMNNYVYPDVKQKRKELTVKQALKLLENETIKKLRNDRLNSL